MTQTYKILFIVFTFCFLFTSEYKVKAVELVQDKVEIMEAEVTKVISQTSKSILDTGVKDDSQMIEVKILEGDKKGEIITIENDYILLKEGQNFFLYHSVDGMSGREIYSVKDIDRRPVILSFITLFVLVVIFFSGRQGLRSLMGLLGSFFVIIYVLIPSLLHGYPPIITSISVATIILFLAIYLTHGFNRVSTIAFSGTVLAVVITGILAYIGVTLAHFTGVATEEAFYLDINTQGVLDLRGLLLGGIMIGVLGVLDDLAVTQAAIVRELYHSLPNISKKEVYSKAIRVGKEHVGALVNTLALAYTGASLPLLLLFSSANSNGFSVMNQEIFATEIIRTVVGSIGLILTVPITTFLAVHFLKDYKSKKEIYSHFHHTH